MASHPLLDQGEEDDLHRQRLLQVEDKPFRRIKSRLLTPKTVLLASSTVLPPTPPPDASAADEAAAAHERAQQERLVERRAFREDVILDFAAFESSIARVQFLLSSNEKERERYAAEKLRIQSTAQAVRDSTAQLRLELEAAQKTLAVRKTWDELTEKITSNRMLRPRKDQHANLDKLNAEIAELEAESKAYAETWSERREQFGRIVKEGMEMRRLIRDEKEEVERREGMEGDADGEGEGDDEEGEVPTSRDGTPRLHDGTSPGPVVVPQAVQLEVPGSDGLRPQLGKRSRGPSPSAEVEQGEIEDAPAEKRRKQGIAGVADGTAGSSTPSAKGDDQREEDEDEDEEEGEVGPEGDGEVEAGEADEEKGRMDET
ncbi:MAG: hypothetical protein M1832_001496 [Thelocarpon impressellum]|nr:MAG: hypothetical protein M1832_001496 [Thelocarpon impressellum]